MDSHILFHLCSLIYVSYRFRIGNPTFPIEKGHHVSIYDWDSLPQVSQAETLMGYELEQITDRYFQEQCRQTCTTTGFMRFDVSDHNNQLQITAEVHEIKRAFGKCLVQKNSGFHKNFGGWDSVYKVFRYELENQGHYYLLFLEPGVWEIPLRVPLKKQPI